MSVSSVSAGGSMPEPHGYLGSVCEGCLLGPRMIMYVRIGRPTTNSAHPRKRVI